MPTIVALDHRYEVSEVTRADVRIPFKFIVIHGDDPSRRSDQHSAVTRSLSLTGLIFDTPRMVVDGFHLSFTEYSFARNSLELILDLGKAFGTVDALAQVEWYERQTADVFSVGVEFGEMHTDARNAIRRFIEFCVKGGHEKR
jgi:hypothetical protein